MVNWASVLGVIPPSADHAVLMSPPLLLHHLCEQPAERPPPCGPLPPSAPSPPHATTCLILQTCQGVPPCCTVALPALEASLHPPPACSPALSHHHPCPKPSLHSLPHSISQRPPPPAKMGQPGSPRGPLQVDPLHQAVPPVPHSFGDPEGIPGMWGEGLGVGTVSLGGWNTD